MASLPGNLHRDLENAIIQARDVAVDGSREALEALTVHEGKRGSHLTKEQASLRNRLRAHGHQIGDARNRKNGAQEIFQLEQECAYEHWHRMIFARFLAENNLLVEPDSQVSVTLEEVEELAREEGIDHWGLAARYAQAALPAIFRVDDPLLEVTLPRETRLKLEQILESLPSTVFVADDSLGWVYQFWQSAEKKRVNESGDKITGETLPAVTQLFTEPYMVSFLLHNTLGAWHAGKVLSESSQLAESAEDEAELRNAVRLDEVAGYEFEYLRFVRSPDEDDSSKEEGGSAEATGPWRPMGGTFDSWPRSAAELKVLDPCCGSGHFLVAAFNLLVRLRMHEEELSAREAVAAVLCDNLFGLEIDPRCTQIAAFSLAVAAWKFPDESGEPLGYHGLPSLNIACTGIGPQASEDEWLKLAEQSGLEMNALSREPILNGLGNLHALFSDAPTLGSLIDPNVLRANLIAADYETLEQFLKAALAAERSDDEAHERAVAAAGMVKAAELLTAEYVLVITNVPYLGDRKQGPRMKDWIEEHEEDGKADLAAAFVSRAVRFLSRDGTLAVVSPQNWLFGYRYTDFRERMLKTLRWNAVIKLGEHAFHSDAAAGAFTACSILSYSTVLEGSTFRGIDAAHGSTPDEKDSIVRGDASILRLDQRAQLNHPDHRVVLGRLDDGALLSSLCSAPQGVKTGDDDVWVRRIWELPSRGAKWIFYQTTVRSPMLYGGRSLLLDWSSRGLGMVRPRVRCSAVGHVGVAISQMRELPPTVYTGERFDSNVAPIVPDDESLVPALWMFCASDAFADAVRQLDQKVGVTNATLIKVAFDAEYWAEVASRKYPDGLPDPESDDPTQWLFHGRPEASESPLQVAIARLLGHRWPAELDSEIQMSDRARELVARCEELLPLADRDGIVCIPSVRGEESAETRLSRLLTSCGLKPPHHLDDWLRNSFFQEHCELFQNFPFVWHVWDGRKSDGFHALVNYHKLAGPDGHKLLESLTYSYLGDWINRQESDVNSGVAGADGRLAAAKALQDRLKAILSGEPPHDIFVRWKPLHEQPIGWHPDINDGVRLNIRPYMAVDIAGGRKGAGILRTKPNINWKKYKGKQPFCSKEDFPWFWGWDEETQDFAGGETFTAERWNDCHYTNEFKQAARDRNAQEGEA